MAIAISAADAADVPAIVDIERKAFSDPWSTGAFREALTHPAVFFVCARHHGKARRDADQVAGYVVAWFAADEGEIANLAVDPSGWGVGVGRALLDAALEEGERRGATAVYLEVRDSNERARRLYKSRHFEEVGRRTEYYQRPVEDAIVLRCMLNA
ncbi:MAG TPA: ribosomal protein S18-alanine N-acetyltransferase [Gemmatimonadaceae bacterium]|jgi:ribosomal-protein-alanine N-acetyltransferase